MSQRGPREPSLGRALAHALTALMALANCPLRCKKRHMHVDDHKTFSQDKPKLVADWLPGVRLLQYPRITDGRGTLIPFDTDSLPFLPRRFFIVEGSENGSIRGGHAHRTARQLFCCVAGRVTIQVRQGDQQLEGDLVPDGAVLIVEAGVWSTQTYSSIKDRLLVLSDENYSAGSYVE